MTCETFSGPPGRLLVCRAILGSFNVVPSGYPVVRFKSSFVSELECANPPLLLFSSPPPPAPEVACRLLCQPTSPHLRTLLSSPNTPDKRTTG